VIAKAAEGGAGLMVGNNQGGFQVQMPKSDKQEIAARSRHGPAPESTGATIQEWHYATIRYLNRDIGLLIETEDQKLALREAQSVCKIFGRTARVVDLRKVVVQ
jgi:hypothetical protein